MEMRYYVCGLGYDENECITDHEQSFGDFDTYEEAYEFFVKLQCRDVASFFEKAPDVYQLLIQLEECEEDDEAIECVEVRNEWWIENPRFRGIKTRSYLEILNELKETLETDVIPKEDKNKINNTLQQLFYLLWKYSN